MDEMADDPADTEVRIETPTIPIPANLNLSSSASAMIRFSESGVDESVILAYITNSPAEFDLGADEIIYLNDLGVAPSVIRGMIEHDVLLKSAAKQTGTPPKGVIGEENSPPPADERPAPEYVALPGQGPSSDGAFTDEPAPIPAPDDYDPSASFNDALAPYGTWVDVRGYGRCWQPAAVMGNPNWRPYWDRGHWLNTDCGWYWTSEYSWGWAPFHYGRWFQHPQIGWCWSPDSVWGPSWVTWRSSMDICGWAPLPPGAGFTNASSTVTTPKVRYLFTELFLEVGAFFIRM